MVRKKTEAAKSAELVPVPGARRLLTVEIVEWTEKDKVVATSVQGAIVRIRPAEGSDETAIERARAAFQAGGAARVTVLPRPKAEVVPNAEKEKAPAKAEGAREAILALVEESNAKDRAALRDLCEKVMAEVGL